MAVRLLDGSAWVGCALLWLPLVTSGCSGGSWAWPGYSPEDGEYPATAPKLEGFHLYSELGRSCRAAVDLSPADHYGSLSFIPCTTGEAGCEQLDWDGQLSWDPTGSGDMLKFSLQLGFASSGELRHLLITHQYPTKTTDGIPFEAVAYEATSGVPVA